MSTTEARLLLVEDSPGDAELLERALRRLPRQLTCSRVQDGVEFQAALEQQGWDLVLCDYGLPGFDPFEALDIIRTRGLDLPLIVVSGTVGEERAADLMRAGARDLVLKGKPTRLIPAVTRELEELELRRSQRRSLSAAQSRLQCLADSSFVGIGVGSHQGAIIDANDAFLRMIGRNRTDLACSGVRWDQFIALEDRPMAMAARDAMLCGRQAAPFEYRVVHPDGSNHWVLCGLAPLASEEGAIALMLDVSDLHAARASLAASERLYRRLFEQNLAAVFRATIEGGVLEANSAFLSMLDYPSRASLPAAGLTELVNNFSSLVKRLQSSPRGVETELALKRRDGAPAAALANLSLAETSGETAQLYGTLIDITARKALEEQYRHAQKMEVVGRLAGGIAHDFNNILTVINGFSEMLLNKSGFSAVDRKWIGEIHHAGERAAGLTRQLLAFSRQEVVQPRVLDLSDVLAGMDRMLRRLIGEDVELQIQADKESAWVKADPGHIEQIIMNLAVNARDAMPDGGQLRISTSHAEISEAYARGHIEAAPGRHVELIVGDNGVGMDAATQARIFEPFFTTKPAGKGTGLGLATVYAIVKNYDGWIELKTQPGAGTEFHIFLASMANPQSAARPATNELIAPFGGGDTILLAEDEPAVRSVISGILRAAGFYVLEHANAETATAAMAARTGHIQLLITDVIMPGTSGVALSKAAAALVPGIKTLFISGYTDRTTLPTDFGAHAAFLQKPFSSAELLRNVRDLLTYNGTA